MVIKEGMDSTVLSLTACHQHEAVYIFRHIEGDLEKRHSH